MRNFVALKSQRDGSRRKIANLVQLLSQGGGMWRQQFGGHIGWGSHNHRVGPAGLTIIELNLIGAGLSSLKSQAGNRLARQ